LISPTHVTITREYTTTRAYTTTSSHTTTVSSTTSLTTTMVQPSTVSSTATIFATCATSAKCFYNFYYSTSTVVTLLSTTATQSTTVTHESVSATTSTGTSTPTASSTTPVILSNAPVTIASMAFAGFSWIWAFFLRKRSMSASFLVSLLGLLALVSGLLAASPDLQKLAANPSLGFIAAGISGSLGIVGTSLQIVVSAKGILAPTPSPRPDLKRSGDGAKTKFCVNCGVRIRANANFCASCGARQT